MDRILPQFAPENETGSPLAVRDQLCGVRRMAPVATVEVTLAKMAFTRRLADH